MSINKHPMIGKHCVIRTENAGIHIGVVESANGKEVLLKNSHRIWCWCGAFTLSAVAKFGIQEGSRLSVEVDEIYLTEAIEFIPTSEQARITFEKFYDK